MITIQIDDNNAGVRLDRILRKRLPLLPLSGIYKLVRTGGVTINGRRVKEQYRLCDGDTLVIAVSESELAQKNSAGEDAVLDVCKTRFFKNNFIILFEDPHLIVCNKPAGIVVHGGSGHTDHATLIDCAKSYVASQKSARELDPALVHRIDRDTSGVVLIAKTKPVLRILNEDLRNRTVIKEYRALCHGMPSEQSAVIRDALSRTHERNNGTKVKVSASGDEAESEYSVIESNNHFSLLEVFIHTGRTHQIRVHLQSIASPIVGDVRYGDLARDTKLFTGSAHLKRLYLHAYRITFTHPISHKKHTITAPLGEEFLKLMRLR